MLFLLLSEQKQHRPQAGPIWPSYPLLTPQEVGLWRLVGAASPAWDASGTGGATQ